MEAHFQSVTLNWYIFADVRCPLTWPDVVAGDNVMTNIAFRAILVNVATTDSRVDSERQTNPARRATEHVPLAFLALWRSENSPETEGALAEDRLTAVKLSELG